MAFPAAAQHTTCNVGSRRFRHNEEAARLILADQTPPSGAKSIIFPG